MAADAASARAWRGRLGGQPPGALQGLPPSFLRLRFAPGSVQQRPREAPFRLHPPISPMGRKQRGTASKTKGKGQDHD
jgi:hypothetical protein